MITSAYRNGVTTTYAYRNVSGNKDNLLASISFAHPSGAATNRLVGDLTYSWDANKNKTKETIAGTMSGYSFDTTVGADPDGYDDEDRLTYFKRSNIANPQTWELSLVGDWDSWSNLGSSQTRTHGAAHEFTSFTGASSGTLPYDVKGNLLTRPASLQSPALSLTWDFDNRMQGADTDGTPASLEVTFEYDAVGRRVARSGPEGNVVYIHSGQQVVTDYTRGSAAGTTPLFRYVWGSYIDEPILRQTGSTTLLYYHHNQQFSTVALTNSSGLVASRYAYTAYGEQTLLNFTGAAQDFSTYANRHTYTGREWDNDLKLHYFRARWYDAVAGRFIGRDPLGFVDGENPYCAYFSPNSLDPLGRAKLQEPSRPLATPMEGGQQAIDPIGEDHKSGGKTYNFHKWQAKRCIFHLGMKDFDPLGNRIDAARPKIGCNSDWIPNSVDIPISGNFNAIVDAIKDHQCCELIFVGHGISSGGMVTQHDRGWSWKPVDRGTIYYDTLFPRPGWEYKISNALQSINCQSCNVFLFSCGFGEMGEVRENRTQIATRLGCSVFAPEKLLSYAAKAKYVEDKDKDKVKPDKCMFSDPTLAGQPSPEFAGQSGLIPVCTPIPFFRYDPVPKQRRLPLKPEKWLDGSRIDKYGRFHPGRGF